MKYSKLFETLIQAEVDGSTVKTPVYQRGNSAHMYQGDTRPGTQPGTVWAPIQQASPDTRNVIEDVMDQLTDDEVNALKQWHLNPQPDIQIDLDSDKAKVNFPNGMSKVVGVD